LVRANGLVNFLKKRETRFGGTLAGISGPVGERVDLDISALTSSRQVEIRWGALGFAPARVNAVSRFLWERRIEPGAREPAGRLTEVGEREIVSVGMLGGGVVRYNNGIWIVEDQVVGCSIGFLGRETLLYVHVEWSGSLSILLSYSDAGFTTGGGRIGFRKRILCGGENVDEDVDIEWSGV